MIYREIDILSELNHNNIIKVYGSLETSNNIFLLMEYVRGKTLYDYIKTFNVTEEENKIFTRDLCNTIDYIHKSGSIYIDLKPENIIIKNGQLSNGFKLIDFGSIEKIQNITSGNYRIITKGYCSPEIYYKNIVTEENDIWSIGVISFILHHKYMPYSSKLYRRDIPYSKWPKIKYRGCSENAKDLWQNMLNVNMRHRYRIMDINNHPWMNDDKVIIK